MPIKENPLRKVLYERKMLDLSYAVLAPWVYSHPAGEPPRGFDIDVWKLVGKTLGLEMNFVFHNGYFAMHQQVRSGLMRNCRGSRT